MDTSVIIQQMQESETQRFSKIDTRAQLYMNI